MIEDQKTIICIIHLVNYNISKFGSKIWTDLKWKITSNINVCISSAGNCTGQPQYSVGSINTFSLVILSVVPPWVRVYESWNCSSNSYTAAIIRTCIQTKCTKELTWFTDGCLSKSYSDAEVPIARIKKPCYCHKAVCWFFTEGIEWWKTRFSLSTSNTHLDRRSQQLHSLFPISWSPTCIIRLWHQWEA
jgi:hypothetical protein